MTDRRWLFRTMAGIATWAGIKPTDPEFRAGMVLLASVKHATTNPERLAAVTGVPLASVEKIAANCRRERIWRGETVRVRWMDEHDGDMAFVCDILVALGDAVRPAGEKITAKGRAIRAARLARGVCPSCGKDRDSTGLVCATCKHRVKASQQRRKTRAGAMATLRTVNPLYQDAESFKASRA